jgi:hypothetical protein
LKIVFLHLEDSPSKVVHKTVEKKIRQLPNFLNFSQKPVFRPKIELCQAYPPLTLSDRAEIFTRDT